VRVRTRIARKLWRLTAVAAIVFALVCAWLVWTRAHPQDSPFTPLDLTQEIGMFTGRKIASLSDDTRQCHTLLFRAGIRYRALPPGGANQCAHDNAVRFQEGGARRIAYRPDRPGISCPVAAALAVWEREVVQPAADRILGARVTAIDHFGSFSCRRLYGRSTGEWSEHATANAIDIAGFRLADGRRITVVGDWDGSPEEQEFLREVRNGACKLFATTLSPDYNAAHRDHLHLDQAERGEMGWRACR
jgi:hypothetical protein